MTITKTKEPKPIKLTKNEAEAFQKLADRRVSINRVLEQIGLDERLLWGGLKEKYNLDILSHSWVYNTEEKNLQVSHQNPSWAKERLTK